MDGRVLVMQSRNKPQVAVFMVTYNQAKYIEQSIEGVLMQQTDFPFKVFIGDDCSTDGTRDICLRYKEKYPDKIELILQEKNLGSVANTRSVFPYCFAYGDYTAMCEGDDYWTDPLKLQKQIDFLEANPDFAICFHRVAIHFEDGSRETQYSNPDQQSVTTFDDLARDNFIYTLSTVFRNGLFEKFPDWSHAMMSGDWILHLLNAERGKIKFLEDTMAVYRVHKGGAWSMKHTKDQMDYMAELVEKFHNHFYPKGEKGFKTFASYLLTELCYTAFEEGSYTEGKAYCKRAVSVSDYLSLRKKISLRVRYFLCSFPALAEFYKGILKSIKRA